METFRKTHDRCIAAFKAIKPRGPEFAAQMLPREVPVAPGTPAHNRTALDAVASSVATRLKPRAAQIERVTPLVRA